MSKQHWSDLFLNAALGDEPRPHYRPDGFGEAPPPWARRAEVTECPVSDDDRHQVERWLRWCLAEFGPPARRVVAPPIPGFYPVGYHGGIEQVEELVRRVGKVMSVEAPDLEVRYFESDPTVPGNWGRHSTTVGTYHREDGHPVISLDVRSSADPAELTAIIAHELAHVRLRGEDRLTRDEPDEEKLTDFLTVYLGMGIFTANAAHTFAKTVRGWSALPMGDLTEKMLAGSFLGTTHRLGYLDERQFGYALACWAHLRGESAPAWARRLTPTIRVQLQRGLSYLQHTGRRLDR
jgi:hypothetical protein